MFFEIDTTTVDRRDRPDFVQEALGGTLIPIDMYWPEGPGGATARGYVASAGDVTICSGRTTAWRVERTPRLARASDLEPSVFVNVQRSGSSLVVQHGREVIGRPGSLVMYDAASAYTMLNETGVSGDFFKIPHLALALPKDMIRDACAVDLSPNHPVTGLTNNYLRRLAADPALFSTTNADLTARPTIELIRAVILTHLHADGTLAADANAATLQVRILEYARQHLHDPDLSARQIAAAHYISVRHLYTVLAESEISLADWIRTRRLEGCRQALLRLPATTTVAAIARQHGFTDMSSFSRAFRTAFGVTPNEWRHRRAHIQS